MIAGVLEIQMMANMARLADDMNAAQRGVRGAMRNIEIAVGSAQSVLASLGIGLSVGYFVHLIKGSIDAADHLNDLNKTTSLAVEQLAGLRLAAMQSGGDLDGIAASINKLSVNMGKDAERFKKLGISAKDPLESFKQLADIYVSLQDPQQRAAVMAEALGKSWARAAPLLAEGGKRIGEMVDKGAQLAGVSKGMTDQADALNDKWVELTATGGLLNRQVATLLPILNAMADDMLVLQTSANGTAGEFHPLAETFRALIILGGNVAFTFKAIGNDLGGMAAQVNALAHGNFKEFWTMHEMMIQDGEDARKSFDAWEQKMLTVGTTAKVVAEDVAASSKKISVGQQVAADAARKAAAFLHDQADAYDKVKKHAEDYIKTLQKETAQAGLDEVQKKMIEAALVSLTLHTNKEREAVMAAALAWADATRVGNEAKLAKEAQIRAAEDFIKAQQELVIGLNREAVQLAEKATAAEEENARIGKTAEQLAALTIARYDEQIALANAAKAAVPANAGRDAEIVLIEQQIDALNRLKAATGAHVVLQKQADDLKKLSDDWKKFTDEIDRALTDALMRGFESGKSFGQNFIDSLKHLLETAALKVVVEAMVNPVMGGVQSPASGGSFMGGMGNAGSLFLAGSNLYSAASSLFATGGGMASMAGSTAVMSSAYAAPAIATAAAAEAGATGAASFVSGLSAAAPYIGLGLAAYSLLTQDHGTPTRNLGDATTYYNPQGAQTKQFTYSGGTSPEVDARMRSMENAYLQMAQELGIGTVTTGFGYGANTGKDSAAPNFRTWSHAGDVTYTQNEIPYSDAATQLAASRAVFAALQGSQLPQYLKGVFNGMTAGAMSQAQIADVLAYAQALKQTREALLETRTPLEITKAQIADATKLLGTSAETYKLDFVAAIDQGISPQVFTQWQALGSALDQAAKAAAALTAPILDIARFSTLVNYQRAQAYAANMPAFADGGSFSGGLRLVGESGPEVEYTGPSRIFSNSQSKSLLDTSGLLNKLDEVLKELAQARIENQAGQVAIAGNTQKTAKIVDRWNGDGLPAVRIA